jgi:hypothetical protein
VMAIVGRSSRSPAPMAPPVIRSPTSSRACSSRSPRPARPRCAPGSDRSPCTSPAEA